MSFAAGFVDQMNKIQDRNLKKELLSQEMRGRREESLLALMAKRRARTAAATDETSSINALKARVGEVDGGVEFLDQVVGAGASSSIMSDILAKEANAEGAGLRIAGESIVKNYSVFPGEKGPEVSMPSPDQVFGASAEQLRQMQFDLMATPEGGGSKPFIDVNSQGLFSSSAKDRAEAVNVFNGLLTTNVANAIDNSTEEENVQLRSNLDKLNSSSLTASNQGRAALLKTPYAVDAYMGLMKHAADTTTPTFSSLAVMPEYSLLGKAAQAVELWDEFSPEVQLEVLQQFPYIETLVR